jgi:hypothetical protein
MALMDDGFMEGDILARIHEKDCVGWWEWIEAETGTETVAMQRCVRCASKALLGMGYCQSIGQRRLRG